VGQELSSFAALFHEAFGRIEPRQWLELYLQEFLNRVPGQNWPPIRRRLVDPDQVRNAERFLSDYRWEESWMAQRHWQLAAQTLSDPQGVWSIHLRPFSKAGPTWVGATSQEGDAFGRRGHGQWGLFIGYSSPKGQGLLESRLYLPPCWFQPEFTERWRHGRIPEETSFQTEQQLALELLGRLWNSQLLSGHWIGCDRTLASQEGFLEQLPKDAYYLAEIAGTRQLWIQQTGLSEKLPTQACTVEQFLHAQPRLEWQTQPLLEKGLEGVAYARRRVCCSAPPNAQSERWLLLRRQANGQIQCALSNAPADIPMSELVRVSAARWALARSLDPGNSELGLDQYEHRSWTAWHRHMRLVCLAQLFILRLQLNGPEHSSAQLAASAPAPPPPLRALREAAFPPAQ
jgi:SRSO17 transposase